MTKNDALLEEWRKLHAAALQVKKHTPWEWMEEVDVFGVENPENGTVGFVSIMGMLGEFDGISVYLGRRGAGWFLGHAECRDGCVA